MKTLLSKKPLYLVLFIFVMVGLTFCKGADEKPAVAEPSEKKVTPNKAKEIADKTGDVEGTTKEGEGDEKPNVSVYPGFDFGKLAVKHQKLFIEVAKTELCPCPDAKGTLHECLQSEDPQIRCSVSMQAAEIIAVMANAGMGKTDIYEKVSEFIDSTKKTHVFDLKNSPFRGNKDAKVVLVEFADFQCPHCKEAATVMKEVSDNMGDKIAFYYKNFPLGSPLSIPAANASLAAHKQGKFWPMHDLLFQDQRILSEEKIEYLAQRMGLNMKKFQSDLLNPEIVAQVNADRKEGEDAGLSGTPTLYINGRLYLGEKSVEEISKAINILLKDDTK